MTHTRAVLQIGAKSIAGVRPENQDRMAHFDSPFGHVFLVADGMGGHRGGSVASSLAISHMPGVLRRLPPSLGPQEALAEAIRSLNQAIIEEGENRGEEVAGMGSTVAAVLVRDTTDGSLAIGAHMGDSRIYFLRGQLLFRMTRDHTLVQSLVDSGALTPEQAQDHPQASVLTRVLGRPDHASIDLTDWTLLQPGDIFLICSDGLSGYADDEAIREALLREDTPDALASRLVDLALEKGSEDNISVILFRVVETAGSSET